MFQRSLFFYRVFFSAFLVLWAAAANSQVAVSVELSRETLAPGEIFQVQYIIKGYQSVSGFTFPNQKEFKLLDSFEVKPSPHSDGPLIYVQTLVANKTGRLQLPAATAVINGSQVSFPVKQVLVVKKPVANEEVADQSVLLPNESAANKIKNNFFLKAAINKTACYIGENIQAEYKLFSRLNASSSVTRRPSFTGFSVLEMVDNYELLPTIELHQSAPFFTHLIRKVHLFPLQQGAFELEAAEVESTIHFRQMKEHSPALLQLYSMAEEDIPARYVTAADHRVTLVSPQVKVTVKPLPEEGQPAGFKGAIGIFKLEALVAEDSNTQQQLFKIIISGSGNFPLIGNPVVNWPPGVRANFKGVAEEVNVYDYPLSGQKTYTWGLNISAPSVTIPAIKFSFFNPSTRQYHEQVSAPVVIQKTVYEKEPLKGSRTANAHNPLLKYIALVFIFLVAITAIIIFLLKPAKKLPVATEAPAKKYSFEQIDTAMQEKNASAFYAASLKLLGAMAENNGIKNIFTDDAETLKSNFKIAGWQEDTINTFLSTLKDSEYALYSSMGDAGNMEVTYRNLKFLTGKIQ